MNAPADTPLTRLDRCDRCGAAALLRAVLAAGGVLLFCGHHGREHATALLERDAQLRVQPSETHTASRPGIPAVPQVDDAADWMSHQG